MEFLEMLVASRAKAYAGTNSRLGIAIHETANLSVGADALSHAKLQLKGNVRDASWHWQVDDERAIQSFPHTVQCWHAGDGRGPGNLTRIAIEICVNADGDFVQAAKNAAELVRRIRTQEPTAQLLDQHNAFSGKDCPNFLRDGSKGVTWVQFVGWCQTAPVPSPTPAPAPSPTPTVPEEDVMAKLPTLDWRSQHLTFDPMDERVQALLKVDDNYSGLLDGKRGPISIAGMKAFQVEHHCGGAGGQPDLWVGDKTWESLLTGKVW